EGEMISSVFWIGLVAAFSSATDEAVKIVARPAHIYIERGAHEQYLNFDFIVENLTDQPLRLDSIELSVLDSKGKLEIRKLLDGHGFSPGILLVPNRDVGPRERTLIFNPLYAFDSDIELYRLHYEFSFREPKSKRQHAFHLDVTPEAYETKTNLI